jgi:hypothetical protein
MGVGGGGVALKLPFKKGAHSSNGMIMNGLSR